MSIRHPELRALVERLATMRAPALSDADRELLAGYADPSPGLVVEDQLDGWTVKSVEALTGRRNVWSPERASRALLAEL